MFSNNTYEKIIEHMQATWNENKELNKNKEKRVNVLEILYNRIKYTNGHNKHTKVCTRASQSTARHARRCPTIARHSPQSSARRARRCPTVARHSPQTAPDTPDAARRLPDTACARVFRAVQTRISKTWIALGGVYLFTEMIKSASLCVIYVCVKENMFFLKKQGAKQHNMCITVQHWKQHVTKSHHQYEATLNII